MVTRKVIEVLGSKFIDPKLRQAIYTGIKGKTPKEAQQFINSIFTENYKNIQKAILPTAAALGLTLNNKAEAKEDNYQIPDWAKKAEGQGAVDQTGDFVATLTGVYGIGKAVATQIAKQAAKIMAKNGAKAAQNFIKSEALKARNDLVKQSPKAAEKIEQGVAAMTKNIEEATRNALARKLPDKVRSGDIFAIFSEIYKDKIPQNAVKATEKLTTKAGKLSQAEEESFVRLIKQNAEDIKKLADDLGVKSKEEIPNLMKFINQLGTIIKNSPAYIKNAATYKNDKFALLANTGLSIYDIYQEYKNGNNSLIQNAGRLAAGLAPGSVIAKLFYGSLGYGAGDALSKAAAKKLSKELAVEETVDEQLQKEIEQGIAHPGLDQELPEFFTGQSGRKYHVKGNRIYAYDTGRPVNIQEALRDGDEYIRYQTQVTNEKLNNINSQINDLERAQELGYQVNPNQLQQLYMDRENATIELNGLKPLTDNSIYDPSGDLVEQYRLNVVAPEEAAKETQAQQQQRNYNEIYETAFNKIAQDTYADLDNYFQPENLAQEYYQNERLAMRGQARSMNPDEFARVAKVQYMHQLVPQIQDRAMKLLNTIVADQQKLDKTMFDYAKLGETSRANLAKEYTNQYKAEETSRHNMATEGLGLGKLEETSRHNKATEGIGTQNAASNAVRAQAAQKNAQTNAARLPIYQQNADTARINAEANKSLVPFRQASYASQVVSNVGNQMNPEVTMDQFLNSNQSVMQEVFPQVFKDNQNKEENK